MLLMNFKSAQLVSNRILSAMTILYVDDDSDDIQLFSEAVKKVLPFGKCLSAVNGLDAIGILKRIRPLPDHVVLDYNMPIMSGLECLQFMKEDDHLKYVPVSVLSTSCNDKEVGLIKMFGVDCHKKPSTFDELTRIVSKILA